MTGNLNKYNTNMITGNITLHIEMRTKVICSFKSEIYRGAGEIAVYSKTLTSPPGMFTSLEEIQAYIEECEQKMVTKMYVQRLIYLRIEQPRHESAMKTK